MVCLTENKTKPVSWVLGRAWQLKVYLYRHTTDDQHGVDLVEWEAVVDGRMMRKRYK